MLESNILMGLEVNRIKIIGQQLSHYKEEISKMERKTREFRRILEAFSAEDIHN